MNEFEEKSGAAYDSPDMGARRFVVEDVSPTPDMEARRFVIEDAASLPAPDMEARRFVIEHPIPRESTVGVSRDTASNSRRASPGNSSACESDGHCLGLCQFAYGFCIRLVSTERYVENSRAWQPTSFGLASLCDVILAMLRGCRHFMSAAAPWTTPRLDPGRMTSSGRTSAEASGGAYGRVNWEVPVQTSVSRLPPSSDVDSLPTESDPGSVEAGRHGLELLRDLGLFVSSWPQSFLPTMKAQQASSSGSSTTRTTLATPTRLEKGEHPSRLLLEGRSQRKQVVPSSFDRADERGDLASLVTSSRPRTRPPRAPSLSGSTINPSGFWYL